MFLFLGIENIFILIQYFTFMIANFQGSVANSFKKVKEDMDFLRVELEKVKKYLLFKNNEILSLKTEIRALNEIVSKLREQNNSSSIGNERVINHHQQSSTIINNDFTTEAISYGKGQKPIRLLLENKFRSLTDMEFSVFMTIYHLEEELGKVTYKNIANKFNLTEATVRNHITNLMNKDIPIDKERLFNKKILLYIKKDFRELNMASRLLEIRQIPKNTVDKS
nr:hypothetical protein [uncultured archaeon]